MKYKKKNRKKAQWVRRQLLSMASTDEFASIALRLAPVEYEEIVALETVAERIDLLVKLALRGKWLDSLVDAIRFQSSISRNIEAQLASADPAHRLLNRRSSTTPVFTNTDPFDVLDLTIQADFDRINHGESGKDESPGKIIYLDPVTGKPVSVDCIIKARGNSRRQCGWRPLRFHFDGDPKDTIFAGTGRFIDFVTHCGYRPDQWTALAGEDEVEHDRRLHQEFTFYQIIRAFGGMTLETRLASTTYKDLAGNTLENRYGFFRERKSRAPLRCGLQRQEKGDGDPYLPPNPTSLVQAEFHHRLIFNDDYHFPNAERNVVRMTDGREDFYFPYDFDLSGVIECKNYERTVSQNADEMLNWLLQQPRSLARTQVAEVLSKEAELRQIIAGTSADAIGKAELEEWLQTHLIRLKELFCGWSPNKKIPNHFSKAPPALASCGDLLHLVHIGDSSNSIWHSSWDGSCWSPHVKISKRKSGSHPALTAHDGQLHMVYADASSNITWHSIWDGAKWSSQQRIPDQCSKAPSALASYGGLLHRVQIGESTHDIWHSSWNGTCWSPSVVIAGQRSRSHPALASHGGNLHMVHAGVESNTIWHSIWDGAAWSAKQRIPDQCSKAPSALASYGGLLHLVHIDDKTNDIWHSSWDGSVWSPSLKIPEQGSKSHVALAKHGENLHMAYVGA